MLDRSHSDERRLRLVLIIFFLSLVVPTVILLRQAFSQIKWEAFHQSRVIAEELSLRINDRAQNLLGQQDARSADDYGFLLVKGDTKANLLQRSPLSAYPIDSQLPGLLGHFQIDSDGGFSTPLLPVGESPGEFGFTAAEAQQRRALENQLLEALRENRLVEGSAAYAAVEEEAREVFRDTGTLERSVGIRSRSPARESEPGSDPMAGGAVQNRPDTDLVASPSPTPAARLETKGDQAGFDRLREENMALASGDARGDDRPQSLSRFEEKPANIGEAGTDFDSERQSPGRSKRREQTLVPETSAVFKQSIDVLEKERMTGADELDRVPPQEELSAAKSSVPVSTFESEVDPLEFSLLGSGHFVLFRNVWRDGERLVQGMLLERDAFLEGVFGSPFSRSLLSDRTDLIVSYQGAPLTRFFSSSFDRYGSADRELAGETLFSARLSPPFGGLDLRFRINELPKGPAGALMTWVALVLGIVLCAGSLLIYRLGRSQIELARKQQDFVSAVSHELKTPLTSIRMYGEMLREGWADETKKQSYYDYIFAESERLSRLIANVLQLARLSRRELELDVKPMVVSELVSLIESKVNTQLEASGFEFGIAVEDDARALMVQVDADGIVQVFINLIDNAVKFSRNSDRRRIEMSVGRTSRGPDSVEFLLRDFGPGIPKDQMRKIFQLFYRSETELTRETVGTGIGLALVQELVSGMGARIDVRNRSPGAEFRVTFPLPHDYRIFFPTNGTKPLAHDCMAGRAYGRAGE